MIIYNEGYMTADELLSLFHEIPVPVQCLFYLKEGLGFFSGIDKKIQGINGWSV